MLFITGLELNRLSTQLLVINIEHRGINYDIFREMKISGKNLEKVQKRMDDLHIKYPVLKKTRGVDPIAYLTFSMLVKDFDLKENGLVDEMVFIKALPTISLSSGYGRLYNYYKAVFNDIKYFPVPRIAGDSEDITYVDTWSELRSYGGKRRHEGTDIMAKNKTRGYYPILSITDGVIEKMGWLEQGGYRVGIRSTSGGYFYYAHLADYADGIKEGDTVIAGQLLGFMGDSGYGKEGTVGQFDVHLHLGIYVETDAGELSVNPFYILKLLETNRLTYPSLYD
jgi:murein DD-endopeptidase MepM/ murein hydrolase activator NlpD